MKTIDSGASCIQALIFSPRRAINLYGDQKQKAWCWFHLAKTMQFQKISTGSVEDAFKMAISLDPNEKAFIGAFEKWKGYLGNKSISLEE